MTLNYSENCCFLCNNRFELPYTNNEMIEKCTNCKLRLECFQDKTFTIFIDDEFFSAVSWFRLKNNEIFSIIEFDFENNLFDIPISNASDRNEVINVFLQVYNNRNLL